MELSRPQIVAAILLMFCALAMLPWRAKSGKSVPTPTDVASYAMKPAPQVEQVGSRADDYLTNPLTVEVTGRNFVWHFRYSGPDGVLNTCDDVSTSDALHLPCEQDVRFVVRSEDYIYYLSAAELGLRQIAIPELTFEKSFRTTTTGVFEMPVDPMCGMQFLHDRRMGRVIVQPKSRFLDWLNECAIAVPEVRSEESPRSRY